MDDDITRHAHPLLLRFCRFRSHWLRIRPSFCHACIRWKFGIFKLAAVDQSRAVEHCLRSADPRSSIVEIVAKVAIRVSREQLARPLIDRFIPKKKQINKILLKWKNYWTKFFENDFLKTNIPFKFKHQIIRNVEKQNKIIFRNTPTTMTCIVAADVAKTGAPNGVPDSRHLLLNWSGESREFVFNEEESNKIELKKRKKKL